MYLPSLPCSCRITNPHTLSKCFPYCSFGTYFTWDHRLILMVSQVKLFFFVFTPLQISSKAPCTYSLGQGYAIRYRGRTFHCRPSTHRSQMYAIPASSFVLLLTATSGSHSHRTLLAFHVATMHDYISTAPSLDDGILAFILPSLLTPLQSSQKDANVAVSCLAVDSFHSTLPIHPLARKLCPPMCSIAQGEPETCCSICHHQRNDHSSTRSSGIGQGLCIYC